MAMQRLCCICQAAVRRATDDSDTPEERGRKALVLPVVTVATPFLVYVIVGDTIDGQSLRLRWFGEIVLCLTSAVALVAPLVSRSMSLRFVGNFGAAATFGILLIDWYNAAAGYGRLWPWVVLLMDLYLAVGVPRSVQWPVLHCTAVWLVVDAVEQGSRLGVYDIGFLMEGASEHWHTLANCADPPCAIGAWSTPGSIVVRLMILYFDFFFTRGFAEGLQDEKAKAIAAVVVADQVTAALARFDLDAAGGALDTAGAQLSEGLEFSLRRLLANLASYRPYLPQSVFEDIVQPSEDVVGSGISTDISNTTLPPSVPPLPRGGSLTLSLGRGSSGTSAGWVPRTPSCEALVSPNRGHRPQQRSVALLGRNTSGALPAISRAEWDSVSAWLAAEVERFVVTVATRGGIADLLSGDHFSASFGAFKTRATHCDSAVRAASELTGPAAASDELAALPTTSAVCTGRALCGDFGGSSAQRFMVIGGVSALLPVLERVAAAWSSSVLVDSAVQLDVQQHWNCRLRHRALFPKLTARPIGLWEAVGQKVAPVHPEEWMYELESAEPNPWAPYNAAAIKWYDADVTTALHVVNTALEKEAHGSDAAQGLRALQELLQSGAAPQDVALSAVSWAGVPTPVEPRP
eukprot:TRINITY_DN6901_c0_g1_i1.p1 TRINITY_DN6901_c0_g1~~TRINITY_DN6901_c0_g1_i1.p1  ORF type:complete len:656 (+),score=120.41 TRINITY_DN6901_c0_g1_i1:67-1968(+)